MTASPSRRRILRGAAIAAGLYAAVVALDLVVVYPLQLAGVLDWSAATLSAIVFTSSIPGLVGAAAIDLNRESFRALAFLGGGVLFTMLGIFAATAALLWIGERRRRRATPAVDAPERPERRRLLRGLGGLTASGLGVAFLYPTVIEPRWPRLVTRRSPIADLPESLDGLRVLHLTDPHLGPFVPETYLRRVVCACNELEPDLVLLTGDYVYNSPRFIPRAAAILGELRGRLGVVGVLGNHDHWEGGPASARALSAAGVRMVDNDRVWLTAEGLFDGIPVDGSVLSIAGVGDLWAGQHDDASVLRGNDRTIPTLLLSHNPDFAEEEAARAPELRVDLMLSGHTHGGQVAIPGRGPHMVPSAYGLKYASGLVQGPAFPVYVSVGVGVGSLPVRLGVRPDVTLHVLERRA